MPRLDPRSSLPPGLVVDAIEVGIDTATITAHRGQGFGHCLACGGRSDRVHSVHRRRPLDLPSHGHAVTLLVRVRRFRRMAGACPRRTFTEPLSPEIAGRSGRRTRRLDSLAQDLGVALAGRAPSARSIARTMLVRRDRLTRSEATMVAGIETAVPPLSAARSLVELFHHMVRARTPDALPAWIAEAAAGMLALFGRGDVADQPAVGAALSEPWSNG